MVITVMKLVIINNNNDNNNNNNGNIVQYNINLYKLHKNIKKIVIIVLIHLIGFKKGYI